MSFGDRLKHLTEEESVVGLQMMVVRERIDVLALLCGECAFWSKVPTVN